MTPGAASDGHDLLELSAVRLVDMMRSGDLSSRELTQAHLDRIAAVDGPLNAVVTLDPERALTEAAAADERRASGHSLGLLHGLPMTHKDTHAVAGMRSTFGSPLFADHVPETDDRIIARLRRAGAVSTGKSNVPEFGAGSHTFNEVFGVTRNPYDTAVSAGGSSGGLAAALAARIQPLGEGSDMGGSLRIPASFCNVYGFRPSLGVIPSHGEAHRSAWLGRQGPMARNVRDIRLFMAACSGPAGGLPGLRSMSGDEFAESGPASLRGVRVGVTRTFGTDMPLQPEMSEAVDRAAAVLTELGAEVQEVVVDLSAAQEVFHVARAFDFAAAYGEFVRASPEQVKEEVVWNVEEGFALDVPRIIRANALSAQLQDECDRLFDSCDLLLSPGCQVVPFPVEHRYPAEVAGVPMSTYLGWMSSATILSATGLPTLAVPAGFTASGLPTGVQLSAPHYGDALLLRRAQAYDEATEWPTVAPGASKS